MRITSILTSSFLSILSLAACNSKKPDGSAAAATAAKAAEPAAPAAKLAYQKLGTLPLEASVPADTKIDDDTKSAGFPAVTIWMTPTTFVWGAGDMSTVQPTMEKSEDAAVKEVVGTFKGWTRTEKTADGWILQGTGTSLSNDPVYPVLVRRTIGGQPYDCKTNAGSTDEVATVIATCQSLRAAK